MKYDLKDIRAVASAIANVRGMRRGAPTIGNILDVLPKKIVQELEDDAEAVLRAVDGISKSNYFAISSCYVEVSRKEDLGEDGSVERMTIGPAAVKATVSNLPEKIAALRINGTWYVPTEPEYALQTLNYLGIEQENFA